MPFSFYRSRIMNPIRSTDVPPFDIKVSNLNNIAGIGYLTLSPGTEREEIVEFSLYNIDNSTIRVTERGIKPVVSDPQTAIGYWKEHWAQDECRGDVNHMHLREASLYLE